MGYFFCSIASKSVHTIREVTVAIRVKPVFRNFDKIVLHFPIIEIKFRHLSVYPEMVPIGIFFISKLIPITILASGIFISIKKKRVQAVSMVYNEIHNNLYVFFLCFFKKSKVIFFSPVVLLNRVVINYIIPMNSRGFVPGHQPESISL